MADDRDGDRNDDHGIRLGASVVAIVRDRSFNEGRIRLHVEEGHWPASRAPPEALPRGSARLLG